MDRVVLSSKVHKQIDSLTILGSKIKIIILKIEYLEKQNEEVKLDVLSMDRNNRTSTLFQYIFREKQISLKKDELWNLYNSYTYATNTALEFIIQMFNIAEKEDDITYIFRAKRALDNLSFTLKLHQELQIPFSSVAPSITRLEIITDSKDPNIKRRVKLVKDCVSPII